MKRRNPSLNIIRTTTFRLALIYIVLFGASALALLLFIYWSTVGFMARQTDETIRTEIEGLVEQHAQRGLSGLMQVIRARIRDDENDLYILLSPGGQRVDGNLDAYPSNAEQRNSWIEFAYEKPVRDEEGEIVGAEIHVAQAQRVRLSGGFVLLVGRDISDRRAIENMITGALGWAGVLTLLLGVGGGVVMSRNIMQRLESINRTSRAVMAGDLSKRVRVTGSGDEMDQLAVNLNAMLDQLESLMNGMREVGDNIAHDLRSPLTRLRNRLEAMMRESAANAEYRRALEETIQEADNLLGVFNALLSIARLEAGSGGGEMSALDLSEIVSDLADLYEPVSQSQRVAFRAISEPAPRVRGSRELISQALSNLLDNALKFAGEGGRVEFRLAASADGRAEISIVDDGPGVPLSERERVLKRFVRLEHSRSTPGAGLGLSLVSAIAKLHGAELRLEDGELKTRNAARGLRATLSFPPAEFTPSPDALSGEKPVRRPSRREAADSASRKGIVTADAKKLL